MGKSSQRKKVAAPPPDDGWLNISVCMTEAEHIEFRQLCVAANLAKPPGPKLSGSYIVRTLLQAYRDGLEVPGLPTIGTSEASDKV